MELRCLFVLLLLVKVQLIGTIVLEAQSEFEDATSITPLDILVPTVLPTSYDVFSTTTGKDFIVDNSNHFSS